MSQTARSSKLEMSVLHKVRIHKMQKQRYSMQRVFSASYFMEQQLAQTELDMNMIKRLCYSKGF